MNNTVYVTGHRHPDTDSICAAITYANLLRLCGQEAIACRQGPLNEETKFILKKFHQENPLLMTDARSMIKDIEIDTPTCIEKTATVHHAWNVMLHTQNRSLIVLDEDQKLCGICSSSNLSAYRLQQEGDLDALMATAKLDDIARTIGGKVVYEPETFETNGIVHIITEEGKESGKYSLDGGINILSSNEDRQIELIESGTKCLVITCGMQVSEKAIEVAEKYQCAIIETPKDTMHTATDITESYSVEKVMTTNIICFHDNEYVADVASKMQKSRVRSYPVLNDEDEVVGAISRYHTQNYNKRKFVLVDHSAKNQSVGHIDDAILQAVIDHHHIGDIQTDYPVYWRTVKCGCTCTIISTMYQENGLLPDADMSGLLLSAILSDTLNFKSATTTMMDKVAAVWLAKRAGIENIDDYAREMLGASVALKDASPHEIINRDLKSYEIGEFKFAIGQTNFKRMEEVQAILPAINKCVEKECEDHKLDLLVMLFTDVMGEGSYFVFYGPLSYVVSETIETTFDEHNGFDPKIISRKQQLMPKISAMIKNI